MIRCLVIDDEPLARQLLAGYIDQVDALTLVATCESAMEAFGILHQQEIHLLFLDIRMPGITGLNFVKSLKNPPAVIFTTAYHEHAVEAFELEAVDYLLKPITLERFMKAVQKLMPRKDVVSLAQEPAVPYIFIKVDRKLIKLNYDDILYIEALGDYVKFITSENTFVSYMKVSALELLLPANNFLRIHRSYIVSQQKISYLEGNFLKINEIELPIGQTYKDQLYEKLNGGH